MSQHECSHKVTKKIFVWVKRKYESGVVTIPVLAYLVEVTQQIEKDNSPNRYTLVQQ
jgi:hypothetical protein